MKLEASKREILEAEKKTLMQETVGSVARTILREHYEFMIRLTAEAAQRV